MINYTRVRISTTKYTNNRTLSLNSALFINYMACLPPHKIPAETVSHVRADVSRAFSQRLEKHTLLLKCALAPGSSAGWRFFPLRAQLLWMLFMVLPWQVWRAGVAKDVLLAHLLAVWICYKIVNDPVSWHRLTTSKSPPNPPQNPPTPPTPVPFDSLRWLFDSRWQMLEISVNLSNSCMWRLLRWCRAGGGGGGVVIKHISRNQIIYCCAKIPTRETGSLS